jgi:hypothetical protein
MKISNKDYLGNYNYGLYNNKPAYRNSYKNIIYVFKDISTKRVETSNDFSQYNKFCKVVFVTNKQLASMDYFEEIKDCVFDGKLGTRYRTKGSCGSYHFCLRTNGETPLPRKSTQK